MFHDHLAVASLDQRKTNSCCHKQFQEIVAITTKMVCAIKLKRILLQHRKNVWLIHLWNSAGI